MRRAGHLGRLHQSAFFPENVSFGRESTPFHEQATGLTRDKTLVSIGVRIDNRLEEGVSIAVGDPQPSAPDALQDVIRAMPRDLSKPREEAPRIAQFAEIAPR
jgi:hypothetical protein